MDIHRMLGTDALGVDSEQEATQVSVSLTNRATDIIEWFGEEALLEVVHGTLCGATIQSSGRRRAKHDGNQAATLLGAPLDPMVGRYR